MSRLRVAIATHLFPSEVTGLSGPWLAEQADALSAYCDVTVLAALRDCAPRDVVRPSGVHVAYRPTRALPGSGRIALLAAAARYRSVASRYFADLTDRPDMLHAHFGFPDAVVIAPVARALGLPWVATLHGDDAFFLLHRRDVLGAMIRRALHQAEAVICVSDDMARSVRRALPDHPRVVTIENGYNARLFSVEPDARRDTLLFVGTLTAVKNVDVLLQAYAALGEAPPLVLAGAGGLRRELEALASSLGIADRVTFLGEQTREQVADLMRRARALVIPSSSEGYGMVAAEALACGTPVVASRVGGLVSIVASPDTGTLIEPNSAAALTAALRDILARTHDPERVAASSGAVDADSAARKLVGLYGLVLTDGCLSQD